MKPRFIPTPRGFVLATAIHAVLHGDELKEGAGPSAILLLSNGVQIPTGGAWNDVYNEVVDALDTSPLTDMMPQMMEAFAQFKQLANGTSLFPSVPAPEIKPGSSDAPSPGIAKPKKNS